MAPDTPPPPARRPLVNTRATPRQATSSVAFREAEFPGDDPLLDFLPFVHARPRRNSITPDVQRVFIRELAATGIVKAAAIRVGKSIEALYKLRSRAGAEDFARAWDEALDWGVQRLEDCAVERALAEGVESSRANSMLCFVLRHRSHHMIDWREVQPGHWLYNRIRAEVLAECGYEEEEEEEEEEVDDHDLETRRWIGR